MALCIGTGWRIPPESSGEISGIGSLGRFTEAARNFERMLWLNPSDNQGVRFLIDNV